MKLDWTGKRRSTRATVWLATLSTVVGVATGMFTLRDQVFPGERGTARAVDDGAFRARVGRICDDLNDSERARRHDDRRLARQVADAPRTSGQRTAMLDSTRRAASRTSHTLAEFAGLSVSAGTAPVHQRTAAAWRRNLGRVVEYVERLDRAGGRPGLIAAVDYLSRQRSALARDGQRVHEGLERLGGEECDIEPPVVTKAFTLPVAPDARPTPHPTPPAPDPGRPDPPAPAPAPAPAPEPDPEPGPAPDPENGPRINIPQPSVPAPQPERPGPATPGPAAVAG